METIQKTVLKCKRLAGQKEFVAGIMMILVGATSFYLGRLSSYENLKQKAFFEPAEAVCGSDVNSISDSIAPTTGAVVGSKTSDKYHYPWCSGALKISEANKVWFNSTDEARRAGYLPASNCKGLK